MAWCIEWQDEGGYPHLRRCAAKSGHATGSNSDGLSGESHLSNSPSLAGSRAVCGACRIVVERPSSSRTVK